MLLPGSKDDARRVMLAALKQAPPSLTDDAAALLQHSGLVPKSGFLAVYRPLKSEAPLGWLLSKDLERRHCWARTRPKRLAVQLSPHTPTKTAGNRWIQSTALQRGAFRQRMVIIATSARLSWLLSSTRQHEVAFVKSN